MLLCFVLCFIHPSVLSDLFRIRSTLYEKTTDVSILLGRVLVSTLLARQRAVLVTVVLSMHKASGRSLDTGKSLENFFQASAWQGLKVKRGRLAVKLIFSGHGRKEY